MIAEKLRKSILSSAIQGKLTSQYSNEDSYVEYSKISEQRVSFIKNKVMKNEKFKVVVDENEKEYNIPSNWSWVKLGTIITLKSGQDMTPDKYNSSGKGIPYITGASNIINGKVNVTRWTESPVSKAKYGDLLITCKGTIGEMCYLEHDEAHIARQIMAIDTIGDTNLDYIRNFLSVQIVELNRRAKSIIPGIARKTLLEYNIPLPPFDEQKRIVEKLDQILPMIDSLEVDEKKLGELMKKFPVNMRQSLLLATIKGDLTSRTEQEDDFVVSIKKSKKCTLDNEREPFDIPENWVWTTIESIGDVIGGGTPKTSISEYWGNEIPWLTPADMRSVEGKYVSKGRRNISQLGLQKSSARLMPKGSVVFSSRAPIGYCAIAENELSTNQGFKSIVPYNKEMSEYIYYYLLAYKSEIEKLGTGTTFKEVSGKTVKGIPFALPPLEEQKRIVDKLDTLLPLIDKLYA